MLVDAAEKPCVLRASAGTLAWRLEVEEAPSDVELIRAIDKIVVVTTEIVHKWESPSVVDVGRDCKYIYSLC